MFQFERGLGNAGTLALPSLSIACTAKKKSSFDNPFITNSVTGPTSTPRCQNGW